MPISIAFAEPEWEQRIADLWADIDNCDEGAFVSRMERLVAELPANNPVAIFERASSLDSTGHSDLAVPLYRQALDLGLGGIRRRRAVIQMSSSLRNLGKAAESVALLTAERGAESDELDDAVSAFLALALVDTGHEREARCGRADRLISSYDEIPALLGQLRRLALRCPSDMKPIDCFRGVSL